MRTRPSKHNTNADLVIATILGFVAFMLTPIVVFVVTRPLRPSIRDNGDWFPAVIEIAAAAVGGTVVAAVARWRLKARWHRFLSDRAQALAALRCPRCDYDLRGTPLPRCPECGESFTPEEWALTKPGRIE